ncbi:energy transducer TonB [Flavobacterium plurextorum]|uniref:energy transducer TonB n=1 Tax=Flavobacterium TaxID=237 RepID=UPI000C174F4B|nr:energy transducer TonB [Flavobacterium sp. 2]PIF69359.1 TonB-like protein [Flavobacterium sp. 2]
MKRFLHLLLFLFTVANMFAQNTISANKLIYLDSLWTPSSPENYKYTRLVVGYYSEKKSYVYKDHYKSGAIKYIANTTDKDVMINEGQSVSYYENGNKKTTVSYVNAKKSGREFNWYENGDLKSEIEYTVDKKGKVERKINNFWNPQKERIVIDGNGDYADKTENYEEEGKMKNGQPDADWKGKDLKKKLSFIEKYENGNLISGVTTDSLNVEHFYTTKQQQPAPKKGINSFYSYVAKAMRIPAEARNKVSGKIYMTFIVDEEGNLVEPKVIKGVGYGLDENAIKLINEAQKWNPGIYRGIPTRVLYKLPITIITK